MAESLDPRMPVRDRGPDGREPGEGRGRPTAAWLPVPLVALASALVLAALAALAAPEAGATEPAARALAAALAGPDLDGAVVGAAVVDLDSGEVLYESRAAEPLILASNTKLLTTSAALDRLGSTHRIDTLLYRRGVIEGGILHGDLVLVGGGDPTFGSRFHGDAAGPLERLARAVEAAGVVEVGGDLVLDARLFDGELQHPGWPGDQLDRWYAAPVCALSLNDGCIDVRVHPGARAGEPARVALEPRSARVALELACTTTAKREEHVVSVGRRPERDSYVVRGAILVGAEPVVASVAQREPALILGEVLRERLAGRGIAVRGAVRLARADEPATAEGGVTRALAVHSTLVAELLPVINKRSQNHYAEMLLKRLGAVCRGEGSFAAGTSVVEQFAQALGIPEGEVALADGSGLARDNRVSARGMVRLLRAMAAHRDAPVFLASLPEGGRDGTLAGRLKGVDGAGRVRAKTGTIRGVSCLSGYVLPAGEGTRFLAFAFLMNDLRKGTDPARRAQDRAVEALLGWTK